MDHLQDLAMDDRAALRSHRDVHKKGLNAAIRRRRTKLRNTCTCTHCRIDGLEMELLISLRDLLQFSTCNASIDAVLDGIKDALQDAMNTMLIDGQDPGLKFTSDSGETFTYTERPSEAVRQFGRNMMSETTIYNRWVGMCRRISELSREYGV